VADEDLRREGVAYSEGTGVEPCNWGDLKVEAYARSVSDQLGFAPGDALHAVLERVGGRIQKRDPSQYPFSLEAGSVFVHGVCDFDIVLASLWHPTRDRFTVAHELGHYFLHSQQGQRPIIAWRHGSTRIEWEANWFAAEFLMPAVDFADRQARGWSESKLAAWFGVSPEAARVRMKVLDGRVA